MFEWTIRFGDVLILLGFAGTLLVFSFRGGTIIGAINAMQAEILALKTVASQIGSVLTTIAVQKTEIAFLRKDLDELKHGRGFVNKD